MEERSVIEDKAIIDVLEETNPLLYEELLLLIEIFVKELRITQKDTDTLELVVSLTPSTGDRWDLKYVFLDLHVTLSVNTYPHTAPRFQLSKVRGVAEHHQFRIVGELGQLANERSGECMLYELIELVKDTLTSNNMPAGNCPICLESFSGYCHFTITECTHYFHMACLSEHLKHTIRTEDKQARCPSCREVLDEDYVEALERNTYELGLKCNLHKPDKQEFLLDQSIIDQQVKYQQLYLKQKANNAFFTGEESHVLDLTSRSVVSGTLANVASQLENVASRLGNVGSRRGDASLEHSRRGDANLEDGSLPGNITAGLGNVASGLAVESSDSGAVNSGSGSYTTTPPPSSSQQKAEAPKVEEIKNSSEESLIISFSSLLETNPTPEPNKTNSQPDKLGSTGSTAPSSYLEDSQSEVSVSLSHDSLCVVTPDNNITPDNNKLTQAEKDDLCYTDEEEEEEGEVEEYGEEIEEIEEGQAHTTEQLPTEQLLSGVEEEEEGEEEELEIQGEINNLGEGREEDEEDITEDSRDLLSPEDNDVSEISEKTVSFDEVNIVKQKVEKGESTSREIQTQTRRVKRNRNKRRGGGGGGGRNDNFRSNNNYDNSRGNRGGNYQKRNNYHHNATTQQEGEVVYRRGGGRRGGNNNRANCRSYHEDMNRPNQGQRPEYRRHSLTEQNWRADQSSGSHDAARDNNKYHRGRSGPDHYNNSQQPPQQPRFKPPRILRQEALEQAKKLSMSMEQDKPVMHKQALNQYHHQQVVNNTPRTTQQQPPPPPPPASLARTNNSRPLKPNTHKFTPANLHTPKPSTQLPPAKPNPGSEQQLSRDQQLSLSPNKQIFDVSRFQQSILRNNSPTSSSK